MSSSLEAHYDVIVVGGRPAGSTLASRLAQHGLQVLLLERAVLPSLPPASSPAIYAPTLALLDEIGAAEAEYARGTPPIRRWVTEYGEGFRSTNRVPEYLGRDYGYAIDRARFDDALWQLAARLPTVTARQNVSVTDLLRVGDRVFGVRVRSPGGAEEHFTADLVVGADGRFSTVARRAEARECDINTEWPTTLYYAYWQKAGPYDDDGPAIHMYGPGYGYGMLLMDSADDTLGVVIEGQAALLDAQPGQVEALYLEILRRHPNVWRRLEKAERVTGVHGMKRVANLYRQAGGPGWALTGDALHQKDPLDGQGIFDAAFTAKSLSCAILAWKRGEKTWAQALEAYSAQVRAETYPMYVETLRRVKRDLYTRYPSWMMTTLLPWLIDDPEYKRRLGRLIVRAIDPGRWLPNAVVYRAFLLGALRESRGRLSWQ